jgi:hypothetical protein
MTKPEFSVGDRVAWKYGVGKGKGHIKEKVTKTTKLYGKNFKASAEAPKYRVKSDKGKDVIRNPEALEMFEEAGDDNVEKEEEAQEGPSEDEEDPVEDVEGNEKKKRMKKP